MPKLITVIMGQDCAKFLRMSLESVKGSHEVIFCDGHSFGINDDGSKQLALNYGATIIGQHYDQEDKAMNGKQRNFYLDYLKKEHPEDWALCIDADEVVEDFEAIQKAIDVAEPAVYSLRMRHFIGDLGHEDAMSKEHFALNRVFKISEALEYPLVEHPVLQGKKYGLINNPGTVLWHLAYVPNIWDYKKKYMNHLKKSNMHSPEYLKDWYYKHLFGAYPKSAINPAEIPEIILDEFGIDKDEFYFMNRGIELKHSIMVKQWADLFKPKNVLDLGCGKGPYMYFWNWYTKAEGIEQSYYAVQRAFVPGIKVGSITDESNYKPTDLITAIDVLEHLEPYDLDDVLYLMAKYGENCLFSIPFIGNPNLEADRTHRIKQTKEWWTAKLSNYFNVEEVPQNWLFADQLLIGRRK